MVVVMSAWPRNACALRGCTSRLGELGRDRGAPGLERAVPDTRRLLGAGEHAADVAGPHRPAGAGGEHQVVLVAPFLAEPVGPYVLAATPAPEYLDDLGA